MSRPDVSVVMATHDDAATLPAALASILSQEGVALECIVVDDGSTDGSAAILDAAARKDPRLRIVHKRNEGLTRALIDGCALASAPWIARQDADDLSLPGRLQAQLERACRPDAPVLVACGAECRCPEGTALFEVLPPSDPAAARRKILEQGETLCPHGALLMRADGFRAVGGYRAPFQYAQDLDLVTRLAEHGGVATLPAVLYAFQFSPDSISGRQGRRQAEFRRLLRACRAARLKGESEDPWLAAAAALSVRLRARTVRPSDDFAGLYFIGCCLRRRAPVLARSYLARALRRRPWSVPAFLRWLEAGGRSVRAGAEGKGGGHAG